MEMRYLLGIIISLCFIPRQAASQKSKTILKFPDAFVYEYTTNTGDKNEIWIFHNKKTGQYMYTPNDDMIDGVVANPNGVYSIYGRNEKGQKVVTLQKVSSVFSKHKPDGYLKTNGLNNKVVSSQRTIKSYGYYQTYIKTTEIDTLFVTREIIGNSYLLYGFSKLEGDAQLNTYFDLIGRIAKNEFITQYSSKYGSIKLLAYESNPSEFDTKGYKLVR